MAAFDSCGYGKVLFVAHREEILRQAESTFRRVKPGATIGYFSGNLKEKEVDILLSTVQTIGRKEYLDESCFAKDTFDYIIIDEFHHAVAQSYNNLLSWFKPTFLLGLTATPERLDNRDVFALCDYNVVYEARLKEAIQKGWLVPFRYYGVFDKTDYSTISYRGGKYDEGQLEMLLNKEQRAELVLAHYKAYQSKRALGFCSGRGHALYMASYFNRNGVKACAVISDGKSHMEAGPIMDRKDAVDKLKKAEIKVIFSVDMFNEGLDIPETDMVIFLRPTESPTVFLQQLGRGLRKTGEKKYVNVLDFIGNYKRANLIPLFLTGNGNGYALERKQAVLPSEEDYPEGCIVNFDLHIIDLFKRMAKEQESVYDRICAEYLRIKDDLGKRPTRVDMYTYMDHSLYVAARNKKELNIFKDYLSFLNRMDEVTEKERTLLNTPDHVFLQSMENTSMTKTYKMPVMLAFYNNGNMKEKIDEDDIYQSFESFYTYQSNAVDLLRDKSTAGYATWGKKEYVSLAKRNPIHYLIQSTPGFFYMENRYFCLSESLREYFGNPAFTNQFKDVIDYRTRRFYKEQLEEKYKNEENNVTEREYEK